MPRRPAWQAMVQRSAVACPHVGVRGEQLRDDLGVAHPAGDVQRRAAARGVGLVHVGVRGDAASLFGDDLGVAVPAAWPIWRRWRGVAPPSAFTPGVRRRFASPVGRRRPRACAFASAVAARRRGVSWMAQRRAGHVVGAVRLVRVAVRTASMSGVTISACRELAGAAAVRRVRRKSLPAIFDHALAGVQHDGATVACAMSPSAFADAALRRANLPRFCSRDGQERRANKRASRCSK